MSKKSKSANAIPYAPDLLAMSVIIDVNHATRLVGVHALIRNIGLGSAHGPFKIDISVALVTGGSLTELFQSIEAPADLVIAGIPINAPPLIPDALSQSPQSNVIVTNPLSTQYVSKPLIAPLRYIDEDPSTTYIIDYLVDSEFKVPENNKKNNYFHIKWFFTTSALPKKQGPFEIKSTGKPHWSSI